MRSGVVRCLCTVVVLAAFPTTSSAEPPFSDTAGTVFDIVQRSDPTLFSCLQDLGRGNRQIWDKRVDDEPIVNAFLFLAKYDDGAQIEIAINPEFETEQAARDQAMRFAVPLGQLPTVLRAGIKKFSVHKMSVGHVGADGSLLEKSTRLGQRVRK